ncbi:MAG: zinc-binding alcohol dehydrogenase [Deinococcota bacterium]
MQSHNIYFVGKNEIDVRNEDVRKPSPHEVVIATKKTLISTGTETICLERRFEPGTGWDNWVKYPFAPGYSLSGVVIEKGADVTSINVGDRVAARKPHHQYVTAEEDELVLIPAGVSDEDATWFGLANITQIGIRRAQHELGDAVVVIGVGLLGQLVIQYLRLMGARQIIAIDFSETRLELAAAHGATTTLAMGVEAAQDTIWELTEHGADVVYDITGYAPVFAHAQGLLRKFGRLIVLGDTGTPSEQRLTHDVIKQGLTIVGAHDVHFPRKHTTDSYWNHLTMAQLFYTYLARGDMRVNDLISHRYAPEQARDAYSMLISDRSAAMGVVFDWEM